jgi:hypothetical protein
MKSKANSSLMFKGYTEHGTDFIHEQVPQFWGFKHHEFSGSKIS